jgi:hypothetical protein
MIGPVARANNRVTIAGTIHATLMPLYRMPLQIRSLDSPPWDYGLDAGEDVL